MFIALSTLVRLRLSSVSLTACPLPSITNLKASFVPVSLMLIGASVLFTRLMLVSAFLALVLSVTTPVSTGDVPTQLFVSTL